MGHCDDVTDDGERYVLCLLLLSHGLLEVADDCQCETVNYCALCG